ncbi:hypothetical protein VPNG_00126 [Cytospora leucostoma]|uniref:Uncharacterized protein n=1 Tax=Cytospora leucostoma TaxID=1230097 RepID=A0A423XPH2_9PEZI|nr:hypothetical protein VPNG_00126 [Cytospora leucostoma]
MAPTQSGSASPPKAPAEQDPDSVSGAIEGCSRDHHPECYPELQPGASPTTHHGDQDDRRSGPERQSRSPTVYSWEEAVPWEDHANSSEDDNAGSYENCTTPSLPRKLSHTAGTGTKPDRESKGKEAPLASEERRGARPGRRHHPEVTTEPSHRAQPPEPPASSPSTVAEISVEDVLRYLQPRQYRHPLGVSNDPRGVSSRRPQSLINPCCPSGVTTEQWYPIRQTGAPAPASASSAAERRAEYLCAHPQIIVYPNPPMSRGRRLSVFNPADRCEVERTRLRDMRKRRALLRARRERGR